MAAMGMEIKRELRPCIVNEKGKALFHMWEQHSEIVPLNRTEDGLLQGVVNYVAGIVELEDGQIIRVSPILIRFLDDKMTEYAFADDMAAEQEEQHEAN